MTLAQDHPVPVLGVLMFLRNVQKVVIEHPEDLYERERRPDVAATSSFQGIDYHPSQFQRESVKHGNRRRCEGRSGGHEPAPSKGLLWNHPESGTSMVKSTHQTS